MYRDSKGLTWFGFLKTPSKNIVVVHDKRIESFEDGRVLLYHTERNKIIAFVEEIAKKKLEDIPEGELDSVKKEYEKAWLKAFNEYKEKHIDIFSSPKKPVDKKIEEDLDTEIGMSDEDVISLDDFEEELD